MRRYQQIGILLALSLLLFSGCSARQESGADSQGKISEETMRTQQNQEGNTAQLREESEVRDGTSEDTLATPDDFPEAYDYGSGLLNGWNYHDMYRRLPEPEGNQTVLNTNPDISGFQALYLWERGNVPARTEFTEDMTGYYDNYDFRPYLTAIPVRFIRKNADVYGIDPDDIAVMGYSIPWMKRN